MAFDLSSAQEEKQSGGFDLANAVPMEDEPPKRGIVDVIKDVGVSFGRAAESGIDFTKEIYNDVQKREGDRIKQEGYARAKAAGKESLNLQMNGLSDIERSQQVAAKASRDKYLSSPVEAVSEIAKQGIGGLVVDAPAAVNKAGQAFSPHGGDAEQFFKDNVKQWEAEKYKYEPNEEGKGAITKAFMGGARAIPLSGMAMASMGAAALAGSVAAPIVAAAGVASLFGGSQFTDTLEKGIAAGLPYSEAKKAALIAGAIEGTGETLGDYVGGKFLVGLGRSFVGKIGAKEAQVLATDPRWAAKFAGDFLGNMAVQSSTEYGQGFGETAVENRYGISNESPIHVGEEGAKTAMAMSVLMAPGAVVGHKQQAEARQLAGKLLADEVAPIEERASAAEFVRKQMVDTIGEEKAKQWHEGMIATIGLDKLNNPNIQQTPPARPGSLTSAANIAAQQGITPTPVPTEAIDAAELLGTPDDNTPPLAEAAQAPLAEPASMSILDGVTNGATSRSTSTTLDTGSATGASDNTAGSDANGVLQHDAATGAGRLGMPGTAVEDDGAGGVQSNGSNQPRHVGHPSEVVLPDNSALPAQWEVVDADQVTATLKEGKNQPRDRSRAAANAQVQGIANMPDYRRLADSPVMDVGAPTISHDGAIVGGNGRFEGVSRAYDQGTAAEYRARLEADAVTKGIDPATFSGMSKPVLVRRITQPFDTRALAVASNSGGSLQYSALEQAKIDGERMSGLGDIDVNDTGDVVMSGANMTNVRRALTGYNAAELGSMTDKDGLLSQEGIRRIKNALLYKAYGNSSVLSRLVESADPDLKSVMGALVRSAGSVASVRADMKDGNKPADADIANNLLSAVELLSKIKAQGASVEQFMAQDAMFGKEYTEEAATILRFLSDNIRSQKRMAGFLRSYYDGLANEDHLTGGMFADAKPVTKQERINHAIAQQQAITGAAAEQRPAERGREAAAPVVHAQDQHQPENAQGDAERGGAGQPDTGVTPQNDHQWWNALTKAQREAAIAKAGLDIKPVAAWNYISNPSKAAILAAREPLLTSYTQADIAKREQAAQDSTAEDQAAVDRAVEHSRNQPLSLSAQTQERSEGRTSQAGMFTPDGRASVAAEQSGKAKAQADMAAALAEAGVLARSAAGVRNVIPEADKPKWMPVLVKMFDASLRLGYYEAKDASRYVREQLSTLGKGLGKFMSKAWLDEAFKNAAARMPDGFFENQGLFEQAAPKQSESMLSANNIQNTSKQASQGDLFAQKMNPIKIDTKLTGKAAEIQTRFRDWVWNNLDEAIAQYQKANGNVLNTDEARKLSPDYMATPESRSLYSAAVHEPASWLIKEIYRRELLKPAPEGKEHTVVFTAGGTGAGKSTSIKELSEIQKDVSTAQIVYDTNMNGIESSDLKIRQALKTGFKVKVAYVYRDPKDALHGALKRAMNDKSESYGRTVPIDKHVDTHVGASETMHALSDKYQSNEKVTFWGIDNTRGKGKVQLVGIDKLPRLAYSRIDMEVYHELVRKEHEEGRINRDVLEGTLGKSALGSDDGRGMDGARQGSGTQESSNDGRGMEGELSEDNRRNQQAVATGEGGLNEHREDHPGGTQGKSPGAAATTDGERGASAVRGGVGRGNNGSGSDADRANSQQQRPASSTEGGRPNEGGGNQKHGGIDGEGSGVRRDAGIPAGRPGDGAESGSEHGHGKRDGGFPAGRSIPLKSGRNYSFGDADLTYAGSWQTKARQNVEAVELLKKLEGRQSTRDEQATLAKFIGWGSSEIANSIFGDKLDKQLETLANYDKAIASLGSKPYLTNSNYHEYHPAFAVLQAKNPALSWYTAGNITKAMLDAAKPDVSARKWGELRDRLKQAMTQEEWDAASRSTQYAHYTGKPIVKATLAAVSKMGFKGGTVLEPGAGIGVFPGLMSTEMGANSVYTGIEFDPITGGILKQLFPDERILVESFIDSKLPENFYDIAFGNPPFGAFKVLGDPKYAKHAFALHDYFFAKSLDSVKPGGLLVFVTSRYVMDKKGDKARAYMAERADLVGAIRLPQTAFQKNAGTEVVTDVLFLRKKVPGQTFEHGQAWAGLGEVQTEKGKALVNEYFAAHPEMVLGTHAERSSQHGKEYTVLPNGGDIEAQFTKATENLPANVFVEGRGTAAEAAKVREMDFNPKAKKEGSFYVTDAGVLMQREGGVGVRAEEKHQKNAAVLKDYIALRDAVKQSQLDQLNDGDWEASLKELQKAYAGFVKKNGQLFQHTTYMQKVKVDELDEDGVPTGNKVDDEELRYRTPLLNKISHDPEYTLVSALESFNDDTGEITKTEWLTKRTLGKPAVAEIRTPSDALLATLNDTGVVDIAAIAERIGLSQQEAIDSLGTLIYEDPAQGWVMGDEYLSGNVKAKLAVAEESLKSDKRYARNVEALKSVQPTPKASGEITPQIGMNWIPGEIYEQFLHDLSGVKANIEYSERTREWSLSVVSGAQSLRATVDWGVGDKAHAAWLMEKALTGAAISLNKSVADGKGGSKNVFDPDRTEAANQKRAQMREEFRRWLFQDAGRTDKLVQLYNDKFNTTVQRKFDGSHLTLPGTSKLFNIFDHVKRGAWRVIQSGNTYLAHAVGSGKTFEMVISAMEQKRLGKIKKPMMIVPGHMLQQFASEWQQLYPTARLMVADEKDFHTDNRRRFVSRVAMSDLDGVIMTHSSFGLLDLDPAFKQKMIEQELDVMRASYEEAGGDLKDIGDKKQRKDPKIKRIESQIEKLEQQLAQAMSSEGKDKNVRFDEMGVDMLYVDEAHLFRKLSFATNRQMKGIDPSGSQMAWDLYMKTRWLAEKNPTRNLVMASGTPITNTTAELYTVQRFMAPKVLEEKGLTSFDGWASQFGEEATAIESTSSGKYEPVTRFSKFVNVGEMTQMFRDFADVLSEDHLAALLGDKRPKLAGGARKSAITPKTEQYKKFQTEDLVPRIQASKDWKPSYDQPYNPDPIIAINIDARLAAIDMRFMEPSLPNDTDSKLNQMIDGVIRVYKENANNEYKDKKGEAEALKGATQMVFFESGFGKMAAQRRGFNARAWMEKRLRDAGIPPNQLAFMEDHKKSASKLKLFKDVNSGKVRVLVGSSAAMGTGVNAQQRLIALHHLDAPYVPAILEQREGRILRQGNKNPVVQVYAYSMFGSFDENQWGMLARKKFFIEQALSGDPNIRSIEDVGEVNQMEMAAGLIAENPFVMQLAGARADVQKLTRLYRSHEEQRARMRTDYENAERTIDYNTQHLPATEKVSGMVKDLSGDKFTAKVESKSFNTRKEWGEALLSKFKSFSDKLTDKPTKIGEISGFDVMFSGSMLAGEYRAQMQLMTPLPTTLAHDALTDPVGLSIRATNALVDLSRKPAEMGRIIKEAQAKREAMETRLDAPFPLAEQLANKVKEVAELENLVQDYGKKDEVAKGDDVPLASLAKDAAPAQQTVESVTKATAKLRASWHGFKQVRIVQSVKEIPNEIYLRALRAARPIAQDSEGIYDPKTKTVYLIADNIASPERSVWVAIHEAIGHGGIRMLGAPVVESLNFAAKNGFVAKLAQAIAADRGETFDARTHTDEAIAELAAATITGKVDAIMDRYGVKVPMGMRSNLLGMIKRVVDAVRQFIGRVTGKPVEEVSDGEVLGLIRRMKDAVEGVEQGYDTAGVSNGVMASKAAQQISTPEFRNWFGNSKAVGTDGNPLMLYHATKEDFSVFKTGKGGYSGHAIWLSPHKEFQPVAHSIGRSIGEFHSYVTGARVMKLFAKIERPLLLDNSDMVKWAQNTFANGSENFPQLISDGIVAELRDAGYDGIIFKGTELKGWGKYADEYIVFDPAQIKSAIGNIGTFDPANQDILASRAPAQPSQEKQQPNILRTAKKASMEADTSLIDKVVSAPFKLAGWNRIVEPALDRLLDRAGEFVPEKVKAGVVSDYGLGADYIDRKAEMKAAEAAQNRKSAGLVEMLAALTRAESRVAYQWMQEKPDTATEQALLEKLPAESRETLARLKKMISDMGKEAVHLGQMSQEAYQRNNMAYLHRTYAKHVLNNEGAISKMLRARALKIKGNQYKGRGIFDEVRMDAVGAEGVFGRKLQQGQADKSLVGEKLIRFERRDDSTDAMDALPGMTKKPMGKLREVAYWPASTPAPPKFGDWVNSGTFEVRDTKGDKLVAWRDFTPDERARMGELDEVRYAVAQTLQMMTHDIEVGRFFAWTAKTYGKAKPDGRETTASESMLHSFGKDEWVQVPSAVIPGTQTKKYGALAGLYIPGAVWNDIRQTAGTRIEPFGHTHEKVLQFWKKAKTAWSPAVHMNNVMANFVIADWHDLRAADLAEALKVWAYNNRDGYREIYQRFEDSGALGGMFLSNEALRDEIAKQLESIKEELTGEQEAKNEMTRMAKVMHLVTMAGMVPKKYASVMEDAYQFEDAIFRLAAFTKAIRYGKSDIEAGRIARHSFLNYDINAPWIQAARHTMLPFVSFFYRALPMALNTVKSKPWKVVKLMAFWHLVSMAGYMMSGGDEDDERELLPKEKQGSVWGVVPKMVRMPWNHADDAPYFLDIRRWVPVGDVADIEMGAGMLPPWATPGGPVIMLAEMLLANKSFFTEKEIVQDTDTQGEKLEKRLDHLFKGMLPNVPLPNPLNLQTPAGELNPLGLSQGSGQSFAWSGIEKSMLKREGSIGEIRNTPAAIASAFGIKASAYPAGNMQAAQQIELRKKVGEIQDSMKKVQRNFNNLEDPTVAEQTRYEHDMERQRAKLEEVQEGR